MDPKTFRQTEKLLYQYWGKKMRIERLQNIIRKIDTRTGEIKKELEEASPVPRVIASYKDSAGTIPTGTSKGLDDELSNYDYEISKLQKRYAELRRWKFRLQIRISNIEEEIAGIESAINQLPEEEKKITEYKYLYKYSHITIGNVLKFHEKTVRRKRRIIVFKIAGMLNKNSRKKAEHFA